MAENSDAFRETQPWGPVAKKVLELQARIEKLEKQASKSKKKEE